MCEDTCVCVGGVSMCARRDMGLLMKRSEWIAKYPTGREKGVKKEEEREAKDGDRESEKKW